MISKPSIVDNGSFALFIGSDKKMHSISLGSPVQEAVIQSQAIWSNVAISKDGTMIAAVTEFQDSAIYLYSYLKSEWVIAHLYNPTTQQGVVTNNVLYADALEWDYSGEYIIYDAYNQMNSSTSGQNVDYWDISFMKVWDKSTSNWGSGDVFKLVSGIPEGISIGNPSLSKNSPAICAFDYVNSNTGLVSVLASNLETGDFVEVFTNGSTLSYPNYSKLDDKIIFTSEYLSAPVIASMTMALDKVHPASAMAEVLISQAKWGVWYAQGNRPLGEAEIGTTSQFSVFPNPTHGLLNIAFEKPLNGLYTIELYNSRGGRVYSSESMLESRKTIDFSGLQQGLYLLKVVGNDFSASRKVVIN
jgi:hypothetical protein